MFVKEILEKKPIGYIWYLISHWNRETALLVLSKMGNGSAGQKVSFKRYKTLLGNKGNYK